VSIWQFIVKKRVFFGFLFALAFLYFAQPNPWTIAIGLPLGIPGLMVRAWSSGLIRKNKALATDGPYAMTRNPLYVGSFIAGLGVVVMGGDLILAAIFVVAYLGVYRQIILNEEAYLKQLFPDTMPAYLASGIPRFTPAVTRFKGLGEYDAALMLKKHKEWQAWLGYAAISGVLTAKALGYWPAI
jgi:protein-S-isoprenylcysteine O-methyltransferase Ste14